MKIPVIVGTGEAFQDASTEYVTVMTTLIRETDIRADVEVPWEYAGTFSGFSVSIYGNNIDGSVTWALEDDAVDTAVSITMPALATGVFSDTSSTATIAAGSKMVFEYIAPLSGTGMDVSAISILFEPTSGNARKKIGGTSEFRLIPVGPEWGSIVNGRDVGLNFYDSAWRAPANLTVSELNLWVGINIGGVMNLTIMESDTIATILSVSVPASTTGSFTDTGSISLLTGDDIGFLYDGSGDWDEIRYSVTVENANSNKLPIVTARGGSQNITTNNFLGVAGYGTPSFTEVDHEARINTDISISDLYIKNDTAPASSATLTLRDDGVDTSLSVTIPASTTGWFSDTVTNVSVASGSDICYYVTGSSIDYHIISIMAGEVSGTPANDTREAEVYGQAVVNSVRDAEVKGVNVPVLTTTQNGANINLSWTYSP